MLYPKFTTTTRRAEQTVNALGKVVRIPITRERHLQTLFLVVSLTNTAVMASPNANGLSEIVKRVTFTANNHNYINGVSGEGLLEFAANVEGLDQTTLGKIYANPGAATHKLVYPIFLGNSQLSEPAMLPTLVPMPYFKEDGVLEVQFSSQAEMDTAAPTFAISALSFEVYEIRREILDPIPHVLHELIENEKTFPNSGTRQEFELPALGAYTGITIMPYTSATARGDISQASTLMTLELSALKVREFSFAHISMENEFSQNDLAGKFRDKTGHLDFLTDSMDEVGYVGSIIDANPSAVGAKRFRIYQDVTGGAAVKQRYIMHRFIGDYSAIRATVNKA